MSTKISVVVPCYRSQKTVKELCQKVIEEVEKISSELEIILVNDGSPDDLLHYLKNEVQPLDPRIVVVNLTRNFGQQSAILAGFEVSQGEFIVTMDDDLQQNPKDIHKLYAAIVERGDDVVVGSLIKKKHGFIRSIGTRMVKYISNRALGVPYELDLTSFRIIRSHIAKKTLLFHNPNPVIGFLLFMVSKKVSNVKVDHFPRGDSSTYSFKQLAAYFISMLVGYSDILLGFVGKMGLLIAMSSIGLGILYLFKWMSGGIGVSGFTTLVLLILFLFGLLFISIGIMGVYLGRLVKSSSRHPLFLIGNVYHQKETLNGRDYEL